MTEKELYPSIDDLVNAKEISVRTGNCCISAGMDSLYDILVCYEKGEVLDIKGAGSRTYIELDWLYESIVSLYPRRSLSQPDTDTNADTDESNTLTEYLKALLSNDFKRRAIQEKYKQLINSYSVRTQIWLTKITLDIFVYEYMCFYDDNSLKARHFFVNSFPETADLKEKLKTEITRQFFLSEEDSVGEEICNHYGLTGPVDFAVSYYMKNRCYPMFWILEKQLENYDNRDIDVLKKTFKIYQNQQPLSLTEFATQYSISRERVRQIRKQIFKEVLCRQSLFFNKYRNDWNHYIPSTNDVIWEQDMQKYIDDEQSNLSAKFIVQILLNLLYSDNYTIYGGFSVPVKTNSWKNTFLVNKDFSKVFNFEKFRVEFRKSLKKTKSTYLLDVVNYVTKCKCWKKYKADKKYSIAGIITDILHYEFNLNPEEDGRITIVARKKRTLFDIMYEILKDNGNPMHIADIFAEFKKRAPEHYYSNPAQLRHYLLKHEAIICQNRKSVYVLKEWTHVKGGTIRDSVVEFLTKKKLPQTARNITEYVKLHFPETNIASVRTSMFNDTKERFVFFQNALFGLSRKKYPPKYEPADNALPSFDQRLSGIEKFIAENGHFPFASSRNRDERILGVWWVRITRGVYSIDEPKRKEIERIKTQYAGCDENKRIFQWNANYEKVKQFLLENHTTPTIATDKFLYHWLGRAKTDYLGHRMNDMQQQKYLELIKLM
jgi:predicted transcriptional regulator